MSLAQDPIRVMLVDDHEIVRRGLAAVLATHDRFVLVGEAASQQEAVNVARSSEPDVIVMDVRLGDGSGIESCRDILARAPDVRVLMLTSYTDDDAILASIMAGASGYLLKEISARALVDAIATVAAGGSMLDPIVTGKVMSRLRSRASDRADRLASLGDRELQILELIAEGRTNKQIAEVVSLSDKTVKNYVSSILSKLQLGRRSAAAAFLAKNRSDRPEG
jgi:two-component system response regulator DevR